MREQSSVQDEQRGSVSPGLPDSLSPPFRGVGHFAKRFDEPLFIQLREVHLFVEQLAGSQVQSIAERKQERAKRPQEQITTF